MKIKLPRTSNRRISIAVSNGLTAGGRSRGLLLATGGALGAHALVIFQANSFVCQPNAAGENPCSPNRRELDPMFGDPGQFAEQQTPVNRIRLAAESCVKGAKPPNAFRTSPARCRFKPRSLMKKRKDSYYH